MIKHRIKIRKTHKNYLVLFSILIKNNKKRLVFQRTKRLSIHKRISLINVNAEFRFKMLTIVKIELLYINIVI